MPRFTQRERALSPTVVVGRGAPYLIPRYGPEAHTLELRYLGAPKPIHTVTSVRRTWPHPLCSVTSGALRWPPPPRSSSWGVEVIRQHPGPVQVVRKVIVKVPGKHFPGLQLAEQAAFYDGQACEYAERHQFLQHMKAWGLAHNT